MERRIDLGAVGANYQLMKAQCSSSQVAGVVKAGGYGLGLAPIVGALKDAGCHCFFVASLREALELRPLLKGKQPIFVLNGPVEADLTPYKTQKIIPVLNSLVQIERWAALCKLRPLSAALHVDTGMNRLGLSFDAFETLLGLDFVDQIDWQLFMSHLSCADIPEAPLNRLQLAKFQKMREMAPASLKKCPASLANSAGAFLDKAYHFDLIRPGIALYGGQPLADDPKPIRPVLHIDAPIVQLRMIDQGDPVSYGAGFMADRAMKIATIAIGYADGVNRHLSSKGFVQLGGKRCPILGRVTMDLIMVDVSHVADSQLHEGAMVEIVGDTITVDDMAEWADTISYEVLTGFSQMRGQTAYSS